MKLSTILYATAAVAITAGVSYAAVDGPVGETSTGTLNINLNVLEEVQVSRLNDISLSNYVAGGADNVGTDLFCMYYNNSTNVNLTLTSANTDGTDFRLENAGEFINYTVRIDPDAGGASPFQAHAHGATVQYTGAATTTSGCSGDTATVEVTVTNVGVLPVSNGIYSDTMTLLVAPNP